jgi:hypothetical protein
VWKTTGYIPGKNGRIIKKIRIMVDGTCREDHAERFVGFSLFIHRPVPFDCHPIMGKNPENPLFGSPAILREDQHNGWGP